jgi:hypothetical protein
MIDDAQIISMRLSPLQERLLQVLTESYLADPRHLVPGRDIDRLTGSNRVQVLRVKLRRIGWNIVSRNGIRGGYRLARFIPEEQ